MKLHSPRESYRWLKTLWDQRCNLRMSRSQLEAVQLTKFRRLVSYVRSHSPYYRAIMEERGIVAETCVPADFPILTKEEVIKHFDEIVTDRCITSRKISEFLARSKDPQELLEGRYHVLHTSGTSGTIGYFVFSHEEWIKGVAHVVRASPLRFRQRVAFVAATRGHFAGVSLMLAGNDGTNALFYDVRPFDVGQPLPQIVQQLNDFQPHALTGYAAALKALAEAQERGDLHIKPTRVGNGGEPLLPEVKAYLERVFQVPVMNGYASSEHLYMAMTLPGADGMYLLEDDLMFELESDHTCVTNLFNKTLPLIRYRMDDVLVPDPDGERLLPFTKVRQIIGRKEDSLVFTNCHGQDDFIHPIAIVELVVQGLNGWQILLLNKTSFCFRARFDPTLTDPERKATCERIRAALNALLSEKEMLNVSFEIEPVESLPVDPLTGKFRLVVREVERTSDRQPDDLHLEVAAEASCCG